MTASGSDKSATPFILLIVILSGFFFGNLSRLAALGKSITRNKAK